MPRVIILGGGESGWGTAMLARKEGLDVFLSDSGTLAPRYRTALTEAGVGFEEGGHNKVFGMNASIAVKSPGIPESAQVVGHFTERSIPVVSEIEFAARYSRGKTICITGSNGKTTTATLTHKILEAAGYDVALSGNIGLSYAAQIAENDREWYVLELSSFQLDGIYGFRPNIAVILNITPDHLDRYDYDMDKYAASKMRITSKQLPEDYLIYNVCDDIIMHRTELSLSRAVKLPFSICRGLDGYEDDGTRVAASPISGGGFLDDSSINVFVHGKNFSMPTGELGLEGRHNAGNAIAASLAAMAAGVDKHVVMEVLKDFHGVEHRMEAAGTIGGVKFINDSKATNTDAAWYALEGTPGPIVWMAGGTDKGNDYSELRKVADGKVKALVCMGADNRKLVDNFKGIIPEIVDTHSLDEAMKAAVSCATEGDTVLLSPACASFDLFSNYEERGSMFKKWIGEYGRDLSTT